MRSSGSRFVVALDALRRTPAYVAFGILYVLYNAVGTAFVHNWGPVDYWEHLAAIGAISRDPLNPTDPFVVTTQGSHLFTPYHVAWALIARVSHLKVYALAPAMAAVNSALFVFGARAMARRLTGDVRWALPFAFALLFLWLRPWPWSGFYNFGLLPLTAMYPYLFAFSLMLLLLGRATTHERGGSAVLRDGLGVALIFEVHPLTGSFVALALVIQGLTDSRLSPRARFARTFGSVAGGLALALAWPYFSVIGAIAESRHFAEQGLAGDWWTFYGKWVLRLAPAGLGLVYYVLALRSRAWDWVCWTLIAVLAVYLLNPVSTRNPVLSRYVVFVAFLLHCGVLRLLAGTLGEETHGVLPAPWKKWGFGRVVLTSYVLLVIGAGALEVRASMGWWGAPWGMAAANPAGDRAVGDIARRFGALAPYVGSTSVVMARMNESWVMPAILGTHVVGVLHGGVSMPDFEARRTAVSRFFDPQASADERWGIIAQYRVTHVLVLKSEVRQLEELLTPGLRLVYSDDYYELRAVCETERIPSPEPAPGRPGLDSSAGRGLPITGR